MAVSYVAICGLSIHFMRRCASVLQDAQLRLAAVVGLGYAYAGSCREEC